MALNSGSGPNPNDPTGLGAPPGREDVIPGAPGRGPIAETSGSMQRMQARSAAEKAAMPKTYDQLIREQLQRMLDYYDPNGQYAQNMSTNTLNAVNRNANARGIRGPLSMTGAQQGVANTLQGVAGQRDAAAQGLLSLGAGHDVNVDQLRQNQGQFNQDIALRTRAMADQNAQQDRQWKWQTNPFNAYVAPLLGAAVGAGGQIAGAYMGRPPSLGGGGGGNSGLGGG